MFITFEGGEGCGKTTQTSLLAQAFIAAGHDCITTREPGGTENAEAIRELLINKKYNFKATTELLLINAARFEHVQDVIIPALKKNQIVICDRFVDSTMAYQGFGRKLGKKNPAILHNLFLDGVAPNLTIILDINPETGLARSRSAGNDNSFEDENLEFHKRVRLGFQEIANMAHARCITIDADQPVKTVHMDIIEALNNRLNIALAPATKSATANV